ncbi:g11803 [Coccomyxa elongata]
MALAEAVQVEVLTDGERLLRSDQRITDLIIVRDGQLHSVQPQTFTFGPGTVVGLHDLLLGQRVAADVGAVGGPARIWRIPEKAFRAIARQHPDLSLLLFQAAFGATGALTRALQDDATKWQALRPFLVASPKRGIIGNSKYAMRLRRDILEAARDPTRSAVFIFGEPGLEKDEAAALIHFGSRDRREPMARVDCERAGNALAADVFGAGSRPGLLTWLGSGTLLLNNVHLAAPSTLPALQRLVRDGSYRPLQSSAAKIIVDAEGGNGEVWQSSSARILMSSEQRMPDLEPLATLIKVPPLRVRPGDIADLARYFVGQAARRKGLPQARLTEEAVKHLESYTFPNNIKELESILDRAASQLTGDQAMQVPEDVFWFATQAKDRFRWNLLRPLPLLQRLFRSELWPEAINFRFTAYVYPALVALLLFGPQDRAHNFGLNLFWCYWWPLMFIAYPFLGRIWCAVCPFMIYGEIVQRWRLAQGAVLRKWPHKSVGDWGPWFLWALFMAILVWEEVWDLPQTAYLSGWLLIIITVGAMVCSWFFERRLWCRYLCPIGGMNGMFAKLSMTELRAQPGVCSGNCSTYHCYKGGPEEPPAGLETNGCPLYSHPAQLVDNRNCVLCMECDKACPHDNVEFRLRVPGVDLWSTHKPLIAELALLFTLLGAVYLHHLPQLLQQLGLDPDLVEPQGSHILVSTLVLLAPGFLALGAHGLYVLADALSAALSGPSVARGKRAGGKPFLELAYGYMPLVWAGTLAHYLLPFLDEAGRLLPVTAATVGLEEWGSGLPVFVEDGAVIAFLQGTCLLSGAALSLLLTRKIGARPWLRLAPQCLAILGFTAQLWALLLP